MLNPTDNPKGTIMHDAVNRYLDTWNASGVGDRERLLAVHWARDCEYVDPMVEARGLDAMSATIGAVRAQFPGFVFTLLGDVDAHHRQCRFQWGLAPAGEAPVVVGFDVMVLDGDGRIADIRGFLDRVPR